jgi:GNAT superfamily N-acetyltransferase
VAGGGGEVVAGGRVVGVDECLDEQAVDGGDHHGCEVAGVVGVDRVVERVGEPARDAFYDDPPFVWMMPVERKRSAQLRRFFEIELRAVGIARGNVWTAAELPGAVISTPPGNWRLPPSAMLRHGLAYTRAFGARLPQATVLLSRMESRHPRQPHHYIPFVGVAPERQGAGIGTRLMQPTLDRCDQEQLPAYLEATTERNAALYTRLGFEQVAELQYGATQPLLLMLRPPASPKAADG